MRNKCKYKNHSSKKVKEIEVKEINDKRKQKKTHINIFNKYTTHIHQLCIVLSSWVTYGTRKKTIFPRLIQKGPE